MPKRNLVWVAIAAVIAVLLWKVPENFVRRDALYNRFSPLLDVRVQVLKNYVEPVDDKVLLRGAIDGMLNRLDPYSEYYDNTQYEQFQKQTEGRFEGIGIEVAPGPAGGLIVVSPIEGSPAFQEGLRSGDLIVEIDGVKTDSMELEKGVRLITGKPGTNVTLTILRQGVTEPLQKTIRRGIITIRTIRGWSRSAEWEWDYIIDPDLGIAYIRISRFEGHTDEQFDSVVKELLAREGLRGLIIDVRDNPGGLLDVVVRVANRFIAEGVIVSTKGRNTPEKPYLAVPGNTYPYFPVVILVNKGSASASEILAGALKDHHRATLVGEQTFGKGSVQELIRIENNGGAVKLTTAYYYLPNGERIHGRGVVPDVILDLTQQERTKLMESQMAVYSTATSTAPTATQPTTSSAPSRVSINVDADRQLREALKLLQQRITSQPAGV